MLTNAANWTSHKNVVQCNQLKKLLVPVLSVQKLVQSPDYITHGICMCHPGGLWRHSRVYVRFWYIYALLVSELLYPQDRRRRTGAYLSCHRAVSDVKWLILSRVLRIVTLTLFWQFDSNLNHSPALLGTEISQRLERAKSSSSGCSDFSHKTWLLQERPLSPLHTSVSALNDNLVKAPIRFLSVCVCKVSPLKCIASRLRPPLSGCLIYLLILWLFMEVERHPSFC